MTSDMISLKPIRCTGRWWNNSVTVLTTRTRIYKHFFICNLYTHILIMHKVWGVFQNQPTISSQTQNQLFFCHYYSSIKFAYYPYVFELFTKLQFLFNFLLISKLTKNQIHPNYFFLFTKIPSSSIFPTTMNHHFWALKLKNSIFNHFFSHSNQKNFISSHLLYISI